MLTLPSPLRLLGQALVGLLVLQCCCVAGVQAAVVEVDLVFPRNDTYSTGPIPLLFAVQNSALAVPLAMTATFNVTDTLPIPPSLNKGRSSCNVLAPGPFPPANPCAIAMGPKVAAAAVNLTRQSFCESVATPKSTSTPLGNAAARGAPLWPADAGPTTWLASVLSVIGVTAGLY